MAKSLKEIAAKINGKIIGEQDILINGISGIKEAKQGEITFLANPKYKSFIDTTKASAIITSKDINSASKTIIQTENPSLAFTKVISMFLTKKADHHTGISEKASIAANAKIHNTASVGAFSVIEQGAVLDEGVVIYPNSYIGQNVKIGKNTTIYPNVVIREDVLIGSNVIIHSSTVVGSDGFGYVQINEEHHKIPQVGNVVIEDNVEIGSNVSIDRARFGRTIIGKGTKIDNLVQIAHNVKIGPNSLIISQTGISGSTKIGKNAIIAGQAGLVGHIELGDNVIVGAQSGVNKSISANSAVLGSPARPISDQRKIYVCMGRLPEIFELFRKIKKKFQ